MTYTITEYTTLEAAFDFFNAELFGGRLSPCLITLQRRGRTRGYYSRGRFSNRSIEVTTDEIALNPATFHGRSDEEILSTLVHEMVHQCQSEHGHPGRGRYHNKEWARMMVERGLMPTSTGEPGGKMTGQSVSHYIIEGGPFQLACRKLLSYGLKLNWEEPRETGAANMTGKLNTGIRGKDRSKMKHSCLNCGQSAWAKESAKLLCGVCYGETGEIVLMHDSNVKGGDAIAR